MNFQAINLHLVQAFLIKHPIKSLFFVRNAPRITILHGISQLPLTPEASPPSFFPSRPRWVPSTSPRTCRPPPRHLWWSPESEKRGKKNLTWLWDSSMEENWKIGTKWNNISPCLDFDKLDSCPLPWFRCVWEKTVWIGMPCLLWHALAGIAVCAHLMFFAFVWDVFAPVLRTNFSKKKYTSPRMCTTSICTQNFGYESRSRHIVKNGVALHLHSKTHEDSEWG